MLYFFKESLREQVVRLIMLPKKQGYSSSFFLEVNKSFVFRKFCLVFLRLDSLKGFYLKWSFTSGKPIFSSKDHALKVTFLVFSCFVHFSFSFPLVCFFLLLHLCFFSLFASLLVF